MTMPESNAPLVPGAWGEAAVGRRHALALILGASASLAAGRATAADARALRLGISQDLVADVNLNDARAAMLVWIRSIMQERNIPVEYHPNVFETPQELLQRLRRGGVDALALNIYEYRQVADLLDHSEIVTPDDGSKVQYTLLVKRDGAIQKLADLRGRRLLTLKAPTMCVAPAWLSTLLAADQLDPSERFFGAVTAESKFSAVVLPVFFGQAEACLTSKKGFATMCELNPQVGKQLRELAVSPELLVTGYMFRTDFPKAQRQRVILALSSLGSSPAGRQLMTLFQFGNLVVRDTACLAGALSLVESAERLRKRAGAGARTG